MHISRLEIQGFKTFATRTSLSFIAPKAHEHGRSITAIVGPNGSGKSNVADAIRWVLGEQSIKLLRGKRTEDVIFSGAEKRARAGFAEVILTLDNNDKSMPIDAAEIAITRRLYRDGESEYLMNDRPTRLSDIQLLLAEANIGQKSYAVIAQGMIDHILISSPEERKAFFDDATGVKPLQIKRHDALLKLNRTSENMREIEMLLQEIEPRLRSLKRQASRFEQREQLVSELTQKHLAYYSALYWQLEDDRVRMQTQTATAKAAAEEARKKKQIQEEQFIKTAEQHVAGPDETTTALQKEYQAAQRRMGETRAALFEAQKNIEMQKIRAQSAWAPLPLHQIVDEVKRMVEDHRTLSQKLASAQDLALVQELAKESNALFERSTSLLKRLERPAPDAFVTPPELLEKLRICTEARTQAENEAKRLEQSLEQHVRSQKDARGDLIAMQRALTSLERELEAAERTANNHAMDEVRTQERLRSLMQEMSEHVSAHIETIKQTRQTEQIDQTALRLEIDKLRERLAFIGGIDPEIMTEFKETEERFTTLHAQTEDLTKALAATEKILQELEENIEQKSEAAFKEINTKFQHYFKVLFGGGTCALQKLTIDDLEEEKTDGLSPERVHEPIEEEKPSTFKERPNHVIGIDIQATPPGKRLKALNLLSGGERALTAIALLCAIMGTNPSPFVLLDEVDAALDEANTVRFANIIQELATMTQFIVITHNRATMEKANVLYGVTMGDNGVSNVLSMKLEDMGVGGARR